MDIAHSMLLLSKPELNSSDDANLPSQMIPIHQEQRRCSYRLRMPESRATRSSANPDGSWRPPSGGQLRL